jgi:hypothetical protein
LSILGTEKSRSWLSRTPPATGTEIAIEIINQARTILTACVYELDGIDFDAAEA